MIKRRDGLRTSGQRMEMRRHLALDHPYQFHNRQHKPVYEWMCCICVARLHMSLRCVMHYGPTPCPSQPLFMSSRPARLSSLKGQVRAIGPGYGSGRVSPLQAQMSCVCSVLSGFMWSLYRMS